MTRSICAGASHRPSRLAQIAVGASRWLKAVLH